VVRSVVVSRLTDSTIAVLVALDRRAAYVRQYASTLLHQALLEIKRPFRGFLTGSGRLNPVDSTMARLDPVAESAAQLDPADSAFARLE
jgi:hypothetical protein